MKSADYQPMNKSELARTLHIPSKKRSEMRDSLQQLIGEGKIVSGKKARYSLRADKGGRLVGEMKFLKKGGALLAEEC